MLRLRGELSAACRMLALAIVSVSFGNTATISTFRQNIVNASIDDTSGGITDNQYWREGVKRLFCDIISLSLVGEVVGPPLHQGASALEHFGPSISLLGGVAEEVGVLAISKSGTLG